MVAADLDRDGRLDLVVASSSSGEVSVLRGVGDGTFRATVGLPVGTAPLAVAVGDVNRDGLVDLIAADSGSGDVALLINRSR